MIYRRYIDTLYTLYRRFIYIFVGFVGFVGLLLRVQVTTVAVQMTAGVVCVVGCV